MKIPDNIGKYQAIYKTLLIFQINPQMNDWCQLFNSTCIYKETVCTN